MAQSFDSYQRQYGGGGGGHGQGQGQGQGYGQGGGNNQQQQNFGGSGQQTQGQQKPQIPIHIVVDTDELECLLNSLRDSRTRFQRADIPQWMKMRMNSRIDSIHQTIVDQVNQTLQPGLTSAVTSQLETA